MVSTLNHSPHFFLSSPGLPYVRIIAEAAEGVDGQSKLDFDAIFGPAYKGIPLITNGSAKREAVEIIRAYGGTLTGMVETVDRQETMSTLGSKSRALKMLKKEYGVPMVAVVTLADIIEYSKDGLGEQELQGMRAYKAQYWS